MSPIATLLLAVPAVRLFGIVSLLLVVKMIAVGFATSTLRIRRKVYSTPEDYVLNRVTPKGPDEGVERIRRAHQNDLENILPFFVVGFLYALTTPSLLGARVYFIGFLATRVLHSVFYIRSLQPHRTIAFTAGTLLLVGMLVSTLMRLFAVTPVPVLPGQ